MNFVKTSIFDSTDCSKKLASYCKKGNDVKNVLNPGLNVLESERRVVISRQKVNMLNAG